MTAPHAQCLVLDNPSTFVTLTPEDLPEIHRSSCDGPVAGGEKRRVAAAAQGIPAAFD